MTIDDSFESNELDAHENSENESESNFDRFLNLSYDIIGRTVSTKSEPNTSKRFFFWIHASEQRKPALEIGNIVAAISDDNEEVTMATVVEMRSYSDVDSFIADFLSHNFGQASIEVPTDISEVVVVLCDVMRNTSATAKPVGRSRVYFPTALGIQFAYGLVNVSGESIFTGAAIPIGLFQNGDGTSAAVSVDEDFMLGPDGAHLNVSGISGLASKTSAIEFVLASLRTHARKRVAFVLFNVKSRDFLYVDQRNPRVDSDDWSREAYNELGISSEPFANARFFAPANPRNPQATLSLRRLSTNAFAWDLQMIYRDLPTLFTADDWDDKMEGVWFAIEQEIERQQILSYEQMLTAVEGWITAASTASGAGRDWIRGQHIATWRKMSARLRSIPRMYPGLIRTAGNGVDIPWGQIGNGDVFVIDLQPLHDRGQRLVFGRAMREIARLREEEESPVDAVVVVVDELNKFAPSGNERSPLKSRIVDITARGRSIGLVLFGAEQFSSAVDKQVVDNSSTYLFGRTEANELRTPTFSGFSDETKAKLSMLEQGRLLARAAKFPQPIFLRFPFPPCLPGDQFAPPNGTDGQADE